MFLSYFVYYSARTSPDLSVRHISYKRATLVKSSFCLAVFSVASVSSVSIDVIFTELVVSFRTYHGRPVIVLGFCFYLPPMVP